MGSESSLSPALVIGFGSISRPLWGSLPPALVVGFGRIGRPLWIPGDMILRYCLKESGSCARRNGDTEIIWKPWELYRAEERGQLSSLHHWLAGCAAGIPPYYHLCVFANAVLRGTSWNFLVLQSNIVKAKMDLDVMRRGGRPEKGCYISKQSCHSWRLVDLPITCTAEHNLGQKWHPPVCTSMEGVVTVLLVFGPSTFVDFASIPGFCPEHQKRHDGNCQLTWPD